jgi:hypothetical protein
MKFVMFIYQPKDFDAKAPSGDEHKAIAAQYAEVTATPDLKSGAPAGFAEKAVTVRVQNGKTIRTPGPYTDPPVGGYCEFDAETLEEAVALASRFPTASLGGAIEVRPSERYW